MRFCRWWKVLKWHIKNLSQLFHSLFIWNTSGCSQTSANVQIYIHNVNVKQCVNVKCKCIHVKQPCFNNNNVLLTHNLHIISSNQKPSTWAETAMMQIIFPKHPFYNYHWSYAYPGFGRKMCDCSKIRWIKTSSYLRVMFDCEVRDIIVLSYSLHFEMRAAYTNKAIHSYVCRKCRKVLT